MSQRSTASRTSRVPRYLGWAVIGIGVFVFTGWAVGNASMKSVVPGMISMKINTAIGLFLLAVALIGLTSRSPAFRYVVPVCLASVMTLATLTLSQYAFGVDFRIDNLIFYDYDSARFPGRNAPATNVAFLGIATALLLLHHGHAVTLAQCLLAVVATAPLTVLGGYLYRAPGLYQNAPYPVIALHTSIALMLLCIGGLFARPTQGVMGIATSDSLAGSLSRKLLPAAFGLPLLTGLLVLGGQRAGLYTGAFGAALLVACCSIFFAAAVCWTLTLLWKTEMLRAVAENERHRLLEGERHARGQAESANRMKDEFLSVVSHELRTPLNAILGWTQILGSGADAETIAQGLDVIERNARSQNQIIDDLLDMSRIVSGKIRLDVKRTDVNDAVLSAVQSLKPAAEAKKLTVITRLDPRPAEIDGDPVRLQQIFWNLFSNAIKFTPRDGTITVTSEACGQLFDVRIADTGGGISETFLPYVFDRFRQGDASTTRRHGGLGLGLAIVKQLVELHGGTARGESPGLDRGSTFTVRLPLMAATGATANLAGPAGVGPRPRASIDGLRVLVVDDEPDARALVKRLLEDRRAVVTAAGSGDEAMPLVATGRFDVLVSDIGMPGEDGYMLIQRVRALGPGPGGNIPAIALTAYARAEDRLRAITAGFQSHLTKPVDAAALIDTVAGLARNQAAHA